MPKLSIGSWAFAFGPFSTDPWPFSRVLEYASRAGYDGVEINGFLPHPVPNEYDSPGKRKALADEIASYGLGVSAYAPDFTGVPPAYADPKAYLELFKRYAEFALELGTNTIRVDSVTPPLFYEPDEYKLRFEKLKSVWRKSAEIAQAMGARIVWEFEPGFWLNKPDEVLRMADAIDHPSFQLLFDTSHAYMSGVVGARQPGRKQLLEGGIVEYANLLNGRIGHFHLIDSDGTLHDEETSTHAEFGAGRIDFTAFLRDAGIPLLALDWWCVDFCFNAETERWGEHAIPFIRNAIKEAGI